MPLNRAEELDAFKARINLTEYAAAQGYVLDRRESSRNSIVMRGPDDDKLVIAINAATGHWMYFSVRDPADNGTLIDFAQRRQGVTLGELRQQLRPWIGAGRLPARPPRTAYAETVAPMSRDLAQVAAAYAGMAPVAGRHRYLEQARGIPAAVLAEPRFAGQIRSDRHGNAVFPHYNAEGLCGFELKNHHFTGFAKGGSKGLWHSRAHRADTALVIAEAAIDALSYHALHRPPATRYLSIGGAMNPEQPALIARALRNLPEAAEVILATDHDAGGDALIEPLQALIGGLDRPDLRSRVHRPAARGQDWNDALRAPAAGEPAAALHL